MPRIFQKDVGRIEEPLERRTRWRVPPAPTLGSSKMAIRFSRYMVGQKTSSSQSVSGNIRYVQGKVGFVRTIGPDDKSCGDMAESPEHLSALSQFRHAEDDDVAEAVGTTQSAARCDVRVQEDDKNFLGSAAVDTTNAFYQFRRVLVDSGDHHSDILLRGVGGV
jgi:hypothetical protein